MKMSSMPTVQHRVDHLERLINFLSHFRTSQDDLATDEDEKHNLRLDHTINLERWGKRLRLDMEAMKPGQLSRRLTRPGKSSGSYELKW